jgi:hypothetical protein
MPLGFTQERKPFSFHPVPLAFRRSFRYTTQKNACSMIGDCVDVCTCSDYRIPQKAHSLVCVRDPSARVYACQTGLERSF